MGSSGFAANYRYSHVWLWQHILLLLLLVLAALLLPGQARGARAPAHHLSAHHHLAAQRARAARRAAAGAWGEVLHQPRVRAEV